MTRVDVRWSLADIVLEHPACAPVLARRRLDYCCRGALSLGAACSARGEDERVVAAELERAIENAPASCEADPRRLSVAALTTSIASHEHDSVRLDLRRVTEDLSHLASIAPDSETRWRPVLDVFRELRDRIEPHLVFEEQILFPAMRRECRDEALVRREIRQMRADHLRIGELLHLLHTLTGGYSPRPDRDLREARALERLAQLQVDTMRHVLVENHVLAAHFVPRATSVTAPAP